MDKVATPDVGVALHSTLDLLFGFGSDLFVFIAVAAVVAIFAFYFGRDRLMPLVAGIYAALVLYAHFPYFSYLQGNAYLEIGYFVLCTVLALIAFSGLAGFMASSGLGIIKVVALTLITAGFIMAIAVNVLPVKELHTWSPATLAVFANPQFYFAWLVAPVFGVFLFGK